MKLVELKYFDFNKDIAKTVQGNNDIFDVEVKPDVIHLVVDAYLAAGRVGSANTKTRSEVSGGGKKPWKQKGTGRARAGSTRSPLWRHGGVAFGPNGRTYDKKINKKVKRQSVRMALSSKRENVLIVKGFNVAEAKTKKALELLSKVEICNAIIILTDCKNENLIRATNNIKDIKIVGIRQLNTYELLKYEHICIDEDLLPVMEKELLA